jgi:DNA-binding protein HU-beta
MTKADIIKEIANKIGIERTTVEKTIETFMSLVAEHVSNKQTVSLRGFGNFVVKKRAAKLARNISKNTSIQLPAHYIPAFKPSQKFKQKVKKLA